ncbi:MAG: hypothetical protein ACYDCK_05570 [Thermoplasmatota archaeon]
MSAMTKVLGVIAILAGLIYAAFALLQYVVDKSTPVRTLLLESGFALVGIAIGVYLLVSKDEDDEDET